MTIKEAYTRCRNKFLYSFGVSFPFSKVRVRALRKLGFSVGKDVYFPSDLTITMNYIYYRGDLTIGDRVAIGPGCILVVASHANFSKIKNAMKSKPYRITIQDDAWLGAGVIVLPGVTIGKGAVIGAGAVVTKDVPPYTVSVGNPARVIKNIEI